MKKKLYILSGFVHYEGSKVFGAFSSKEIAQKTFDHYQEIASNDINMWSFDDCFIQEVTVDVPIDFN
jgi:phage pi2 protein 07